MSVCRDRKNSKSARVSKSRSSSLGSSFAKPGVRPSDIVNSGVRLGNLQTAVTNDLNTAVVPCETVP